MNLISALKGMFFKDPLVELPNGYTYITIKCVDCFESLEMFYRYSDFKTKELMRKEFDEEHGNCFKHLQCCMEKPESLCNRCRLSLQEAARYVIEEGIEKRVEELE
jgi:hypothetical protein